MKYPLKNMLLLFMMATMVSSWRKAQDKQQSELIRVFYEKITELAQRPLPKSYAKNRVIC